MANMNMEAIDFQYLLLDNYKKLNLSENDLAVLLVIDHLIKQGNKLITADILSFKMFMDQKEIDKTLASLMKRGFIDFETKNGELRTTIKPTLKKLYKEFQINIMEEANLESNEEKKNEINKIIEKYNEIFERTLTPLEHNKIIEWVEIGVSSSLVIDAFKECVSKGKRTLKDVDKLLITWRARDDIEKEGFSAINQKWDKDIEESIKIAQTQWVKTDDK